MTVAGGGGGGECSDGSRWRATAGSNCACFSREFLAKNFPFITPLTTYNSLSTKNNSFDLAAARRRPYAFRRTDTRANFRRTELSNVRRTELSKLLPTNRQFLRIRKNIFEQ